MDSKRRCSVELGLLCLGLALALGSGSVRAQALRPATVDLTAGPATSWGGSEAYDLRDTPSLTFDWVPEHHGRAIMGMTVGLRPQLGDVGGLICRVTPDGIVECMPAFPWLVPFGVLAGMEGIGPASDYRATIGPMLYAGGIFAWGGRAQLVVAVGSSNFKVVGALRLDVLRHGAETVRLGSLEAGIRIF